MHETRLHSLSPDDRREALEVASVRTGQRVRLLEKDVWVVGTLDRVEAKLDILVERGRHGA